jgi:hypothetical protein
LRIDEDKATYLALDEVERARDPKDPVPPFKKELILIRSADFTRYVLHYLINDLNISTNEGLRAPQESPIT